MILTEFEQIEHDELIKASAKKEGMEEGMKQGKLEGRAEDIIRLVRNLGMSFEKAADALEIPTNEYDIENHTTTTTK